MTKLTDTTARDKIGLFRLVAVTLAFVMSIRNLPMLAEMGWLQVFYMVFAAIVFQVPLALISAELGAAFKSEGGAYEWIKLGLGKPWAFVAAWMFWSQMNVGMVMVTTFIASLLGYAIDPSLANQPLFVVIISLTCIWLLTWTNLRGLRLSSTVSTVAYIVGVFIPFCLIIGMCIWWFISGNPSQMPAFSMDAILPPLDTIDTWIYFSGVILLYSGSEAVSVHAPQTRNVQRNFPLAMLVATLFLVGLNIIGAFAIQMVIPSDEIHLSSGIMQTFSFFFNELEIGFITPYVAGMIAFGAMGQFSTWLLGPSKSMLVVVKDKSMPAWFGKTNKHGLPLVFMLIQAIILSSVTLIYLFVPSVNEGFFLILILTVLLYAVVYILIFLSAIVLRLKYPMVERPYRVSKGNGGLCFLSAVGILSMLFCIGISLIPPASWAGEKTPLYLLIELGGLCIFILIPFLFIRYMRRKR